MQLLVTIVMSCLAGAGAHASLIMPPSRNSIDSTLPAWEGGKYPPTGWIEPYTCKCTNGSDVCNSGQSCFWFSQGCTIGCSECDGDGRRYPNYDHCPGEPKPPPTYLDKKYWTGNFAATPGAYDDIFKFNPWRAPGHAPVFDACGMAGGSPHEVFNAGKRVQKRARHVWAHASGHASLPWWACLVCLALASLTVGMPRLPCSGLALALLWPL